MSKANEGLTGLLGAYGSDIEEDSGSHDDSGAAGVVLLGTEAETKGLPESEADDEDEGLAKLLTPGRMPASASTARFNTIDAALGASPSLVADPARSGGGPSTSDSQQEAHQLPPELAEEPPGPVDPAIQAAVQRLIEVAEIKNKNITTELRQVRAYKNPDFLQKMVKHFGVHDKGSCFPKDVFDPDALPKEDYYLKLTTAFEEHHQRERVNKGPQFVKGTTEQMKKPAFGLTTSGAGASSTAAQIAAQAKAQALVANASKRAKWDSK